MIRLAGILSGSALAIALLILLVGVPKLGEPTAVTAAAPGHHDDRLTVPAGRDTQVPAAAEDVADLAANPQPEPTATPVAVPEMDAQADELDAGADTAADAPLAILPPPPTESKWFAFWSPFRSELAADGFVSELQRTTGLDYRVLKLKPGVYEVAFSYSDDVDRDDKLSRISAATGLDMSGG